MTNNDTRPSEVQRLETGRGITRKRFITVMAGTAAVAAVAAGVPSYLVGESHGSSSSASTGSTGGTIKIGGAVPLTGFLASEGEVQSKGINLAVSEWNDAGGLLGKKIEAVLLDVGDTSPAKITSTFNQLVDKEKVAGIAGSFVLYPGQDYEIVRRGEVPYINVNTQESMAELERANPGKYWMCFQACPTEIWYGRGFPKVLDQLIQSGAYTPRNKKIAIISSSDPYGARIAQTLEPAMKQYGWTVSLFEKVVAPVSEWGPILNKIRQNPPDVIFNTDQSVADLAAFTKQFASDPTPSLVYLQYGPAQPQYRELTGHASDGVLYSGMTSVLPGGLKEDFLARWVKKYGGTTEEIGAATPGFSYDMVQILLRGIAEAGDPKDARGISDAIASVNWRGINGVYSWDREKLMSVVPYPDATADASLGMPHCYFQIWNGKDVYLTPTPFTTGEFKLPPQLS